MACTSRQSYVLIWDVSARQRNPVSTPEWYSPCVAFSPEGRLLAWANMLGEVVVHETTSFGRVKTLGNINGYVRCLAFSPDGRWLAAGVFNGPVRIWDVQKGRVLATLHGHSNGVWDLAFSP